MHHVFALKGSSVKSSSDEELEYELFFVIEPGELRLKGITHQAKTPICVRRLLSIIAY
jgi:hypothetical protein